MSLIAVGTLFPAIPLAIVALNFRYTSLAGLMRQITSQLEASTPDGPGEAVLIDELTVMKKRMTLVKYALFLCGVAFIFNLAALYLGYFSPGRLEPAMMALTILSMVGGISCFCVETVLSTKALNLHISGVLHRDATGRTAPGIARSPPAARQDKRTQPVSPLPGFRNTAAGRTCSPPHRARFRMQRAAFRRRPRRQAAIR